MLRSLSHFLLSCVFISGGWGALSQPGGRPSKVAAAGIPQPERAVKLNGALMVIAGLLIFHEPLSRDRMLGVLLSIAAIWLLQRS